MPYLIVAFAVALIWNGVAQYLEIEKVVKQLLILALSFGGAYLIEPSEWWYGLGIAGLAWAILMLGDLLLVATDVLLASVLKKR